MAGIVIDGVTKSFGAFAAVTRVDLEVADGEFLALLGPSGCGKTTLLRIIAGLETQSSGRVLIGGRAWSSPPPPQRGVARGVENGPVSRRLAGGAAGRPGPGRGGCPRAGDGALGVADGRAAVQS